MEIIINELEEFDKDLVKEEIWDKINEIIMLYAQIRNMVKEGLFPGVELKNDWVFLYKEYLKDVLEESKITEEEFTKQHGGYLL